MIPPLQYDITIDDMYDFLCDNPPEIVDSLLGILHPLDMQACLTVVTATLPIKSKLKNRQKFLNKLPKKYWPHQDL